ncbi:MAG: hypothetical protein AAGA62_11070 [Bacteroidota bacterium]
MLKGVLLTIGLLLAATIRSQGDSSALNQLLENYNIKASVGLQLWATYSQNMQVFSQATNTYLPVDNRLNVQLRRGRFTVSGQPYPTLKFKVTAALDLVGHDLLAATEAGGNNGGSPSFRLWNAYLNWQLIKKEDLLYFTAGYFVSPIGRESNTAAVRSTSFEKAWSQNYLRRHLTDTGPGRAMGVMVGGQWHKPGGNRHLTYELAVQNPAYEAYGGNSSGNTYRPLLSGRLSLHLGDPENEVYSLSHKLNYFAKRKGLTLSLAAATQGEADRYAAKGAYGGELLWNSQVFHLDGEYFVLWQNEHSLTSSGKTGAKTGYLRICKNLALPKALVFEPVISYWFFQGALTAEEIGRAAVADFFSGADEGLDIGANLYFNPNTKLSFFYAHRNGRAGAGQASLINNNYYQQTGVGAVLRGSYFGAGWVVVF